MNKLEDGLIDARNQVLEAGTPGNQALAAIQEGQAADDLKVKTAEADKAWQKAPSDPSMVTWGKKDYNYVGAHCAGTNLETGELPNRYFEKGARNVAGFDLGTTLPYKPDLSPANAGAAFYGVQQLNRSKTTIGKEAPPQDIVALSAIAAGYQKDGKTYDEYARALPQWGPGQLKASWQAGTDAARHLDLVEQLTSKQQSYGAWIGVHPPLPQNMAFDVRMADKNFQRVGKEIYESYMARPFQGTDQAAAKWLAGHMRDLDFNTVMQASIYMHAKNGTPELHKAYGEALEMWEQTNMEKSLLPQLGNFGRMLFDPFNLVGGPEGKLFLVTAGRAAFKDFIKRLAFGAAGGAMGGALESTVKAGVQGESPTGADMAGKAIGGAAGAGILSAGVPELGSFIGSKVGKAVSAYKARGPAMPEIPPGDVRPQPAGSHEPGSAADVLARNPDAPDVPFEAVHAPDLEQRPFEIDPPELDIHGQPLAPADPAEVARLTAEMTQAEAEARAGFPFPPADQVAEAAQAAGVRMRDHLTDPNVNQEAAQALPPVEARPSPPRDVQSRVMIDPATGYYSPIQKAAAEAGNDVTTVGQWRKHLERAPDRKMDELTWLDFENSIFKGRKPNDPLSKEEVLAHIDDNMVKIERHRLVPQRRNTISWEDHLLRDNPEYGKLHAEAQEQLDLEALAETEADMNVHQMAARQIGLHMRQVAAEERKTLLASGVPPPPYIHGLEHMLTDFDTGLAAETREALGKVLEYLDSERTHQDLLSRARSPRVQEQLKAMIASDMRLVKEHWKTVDGLASASGALVQPSDLARVEGMLRYGDPEVRDYSILGAGMRGTQYTDKGIDPVGHDIALYRHPEGLQAQGASGHPGGITPGTLGWAITSERNLSDGGTIRFVDEGQADFVKMRQDAERQFAEMKPAVDSDPKLDFDGSDEMRKAHDYDDYVWQVYKLAARNNAKSAAGKARVDRLPEHWVETTPRQRDTMHSAENIWGTADAGSDDIPAIPKQIFFSTAVPNMFKSELYHAAMEGKEYFGWATTKIIQDRYGQGPRTIQGDITFEVDKHGMNRFYVRTMQGYQTGPTKYITYEQALDWADKIGGDQGAALRKQADKGLNFLKYGPGETKYGLPPEDVHVSLADPVVVKAGSFGHYDVQTKQAMEKFVKKYGGEVVQRDMPIAPGASDTVKVWAIKIDGPLRKKLMEKGVPIGAEAATTAAGMAMQGKDEPEAQDSASEERQEQ